MSYAFTRDVPAGEGHYAEVRAEIRAATGGATPEGLVVHLAVRRDGGLRYIDVWDSEAHWRRFHKPATARQLLGGETKTQRS